MGVEGVVMPTVGSYFPIASLLHVTFRFTFRMYVKMHICIKLHCKMLSVVVINFTFQVEATSRRQTNCPVGVMCLAHE
jgi:hypothetical protein